MFERITPEQAGISSRAVQGFIEKLERSGYVAHSVLMMKGESIFAEYYWTPFHADYCHRMYSQTKSYVGVAIGLLEEEGKLHLDDPIISYFPEKIEREIPPYLAQQTIRDMLTMRTSGESVNWFTNDDPDRTHLYLHTQYANRPSATLWQYDSPGSQVLSSLVEKLSGMSLFDYLKEKLFDTMGTFRTARILKTKNDDSWGDSALLCTARDMASFGRFVMNYGTWNGKRLINEAYLRDATSRLADNLENGDDGSHHAYGYGYQIWKTRDFENGFAFIGMGDQITICIPEKDLIFVITSDNQGFLARRVFMYHTFFEDIARMISDTPLPEDKKAYEALEAYGKTLKLSVITGAATAPMAKKIHGKTYLCDPNPTGITRFSFAFGEDGTGVFRYTNAQGDKELPFGFGKNVFGKFPQYGYALEHGTVPVGGDFCYDCAASAAWRLDNILHLRVQIIDAYLGNAALIFAFRGDEVAVSMSSNAEFFLTEYRGRFLAHLEK